MSPKEARLALWREAAQQGITEGVDWPTIALALFRDLDNALAFKNAVLADRARDAHTEQKPPACAVPRRYFVQQTCELPAGHAGDHEDATHLWENDAHTEQKGAGE